MKDGFIPKHGGYKNLLAYKKAVIIYQATVYFCDKFLTKFDRTKDQMVQASRSGKQNIVEGSMASAVSSKTEITLTNVARASNEELLEDYRDYLLTHNMKMWDKNSKQALFIRKLAYRKDESYETYRVFFETRSADVFANIMICLINQCNALTDALIRRLERDFLQNGGMQENMYKARKKHRGDNW